jgi:hypothetical protein
MTQLRLDGFAKIIDFPAPSRHGWGRGDESPRKGRQVKTPKGNVSSRVHSQRRDELWDACEEVLGYQPLTLSERKAWGLRIESLIRAGATGEDIRGMAKKYHQSWNVDLTIHAIEKWFSHFKPKQRSSRAVCSECGVGNGMHTEGCGLA